MRPDVINQFVHNFLHLIEASSKLRASVALPSRKHPSP